MKNREDIELTQLFRAGRIDLRDDDFSARVMQNIYPVAPSRNSYRIPTLATALVSVMLVTLVAVTGFDLSGFTRRVGVSIVNRSIEIRHERERPADKVERSIFNFK